MATVETETMALPQKLTALERRGLALVAQAQAFVVVDEPTYRKAIEYEKTAALGVKEAEEFQRPVADAAHKAWKLALDRLKALAQPFEQVKAIMGQKRLDWEKAQELLREEAERQARAEQERLEAEARAAADAEEARLRAEAEEQRLQDAVDAEERGDTATAERLIAEPIVVPSVVPVPVFTPPVSVPAPPKVEGAGHTTRRSSRLVDLGALILAATKGDVNARSMLTFDQVRGNRLAGGLNLKDGEPIAPGVVMVVKVIPTTKV